MKFRVGAVLYYIYIFGILGVLTGSLSAFLFVPPSDAGIDGPWSSWSLVNSTLCFQIRNRTCVTDGCTKEEYKQCSDTRIDGPWSSWSFVNSTPCFQIRNRTCVTDGCTKKEYKQCSESSHATTSGPTREAVYWRGWSEWECHRENIPCMQYRHRDCSSGSSTDCTTMSNGTPYQLIECIGTCAETSSPAAPTTQKTVYWKGWGEWECLNESVPCMMYRHRECSSGYDHDCMNGGKPYELVGCNGNCANSSNAMTYWKSWSEWECHREHSPCLRYRHRECSTGYESECMADGGQSYELASCDAKCDGENWSGWSDWICIRQRDGHCARKRRRYCTQAGTCTGDSEQVTNCSTTLCNVTITAVWSTWGDWTCGTKTGADNSCVMSRTRTCSTNTLSDCIGDHTEKKNCDVNMCNTFTTTDPMTVNLVG